MPYEAKLLLMAAVMLFTFTPLCARLFPWTLHITFDELNGWRCRVDRKQA